MPPHARAAVRTPAAQVAVVVTAEAAIPAAAVQAEVTPVAAAVVQAEVDTPEAAVVVLVAAADPVPVDKPT